jgi:two-component system sensor histidine kinase HydH
MPAEARRRGRWWLALSVVLVVLIMAAHYLTPMHAHTLHNVYRRLAYLPIVLAAFAAGARGGLLTAAAATAAYVPHAFFAHHRDPSPDLEKVFEIALYFVMGGITGALVDRRQRTALALERALREREALEDRLVRAGKMTALGHLAAGLAHEIRNPLASILGSAEAVVAELDPGHRKHRMGQVLLAEIDRLGRVVGDFVRFARPSDPQPRALSLRALAEDVATLASAEGGLGVAVRVEAEADAAGEGSALREVRGDPDLLSQVLWNLLANAKAATVEAEAEAEPGAEASTDARERSEEPVIRVLFATREVHGRAFVGVGVHDRGPGIPEALRDKVFDPYFTTSATGTGLGLALADRLVEAHGGFMALDSRPGDTTVWMFLPV